MTPPSDKAVKAAEAAKGNWIKVVDAVHDPALGLDRSVCLRDVVQWLREPGGGKFSFGDANADAIEREFGA